jgi:hypothetical protein
MSTICNRNKSQKHTKCNFNRSILMRETTYSYSQQSRYFWNRYNVFWPFRREPGCGRTVPTTAMCSVREIRYQVTCIHPCDKCTVKSQWVNVQEKLWTCEVTHATVFYVRNFYTFRTIQHHCCPDAQAHFAHHVESEQFLPSQPT